MFNMFNSKNLLVGLVAASVSFGVGNDWMAIAQSGGQFQSTLLALSFDKTQVVEIGRLSTGERILQVSRLLMSRNIFREALKRPIRPTSNMRYTSNGEPILYDADQPRLFLFDGNKFTFVGYDIDSIFEFKVGGQIYWASLCTYNTRTCKGILVSNPNFKNARVVKEFNDQEVVGIKKDKNREGFFYVDTRAGNGRVPLITYLSNLNLTVTNPSENVVVCESYRSVSSGRGYQVTRNPNCQ